MLAHFGKVLGTSAATVLLDLKKFYEHIDHMDLYRAACQHGFNLKLLRGLCVIYAGDRMLHYGGAVSRKVQ
eukprot:6679-Pyramimonas_sp.AAC.1